MSTRAPGFAPADDAMLGQPCRTPRRTVRVGPLPRPRVRPLTEVLAALARDRATAVPEAVASPRREPAPAPDPLADLTRVHDAARPAAVRLFGAVAEILDGRRPPAHLRGLCDDALYASTVSRLAPSRPSPSRSRVRGVRVCAVSAVAAEISAVLHRGAEARGVAARLERTDRGWRLSALVVG